MDTLFFVMFDGEGRLRAGWRVLVHTVLLVVSLVAAALVLEGIVAGLAFVDLAEPFAVMPAQALVTCVALLVVTLASAALLDARYRGGFALGQQRGVGLGLPVLRALGEGAMGIGVAVVAMGITVGGMALGGMEVSVPGMSLVGFGSWMLFGFTLVLAAWFEELLFRGYLFQWLAGALARLGHHGLHAMGRSDGLPAAVIDVVAWAMPTLVLSVLFGLLHLGNPSATWLSTGNTVLAGVWFTVLLVRTRSLWPAITAHFAWNALTLLVLGLPVSGLGEESGLVVPTLIELQATGPEWISGGAYGPEGSIACLVGLVVVIAGSAVLPRRSPEQGIAASRRLAGPSQPTG